MIKGLYAHPTTKEIFYNIEEFGQSSLKPRKWVLMHNKMALIAFYESLIRVTD